MKEGEKARVIDSFLIARLEILNTVVLDSACIRGFGRRRKNTLDG
jgi:hypothetical protein